MFAAPKSVSARPALELFIRGTNALLAVLASGFLFLLAVSLFLLLVTKTISIFLPSIEAISKSNNVVLQFIPVILALGMAVSFVYYSRMGRDMWQSVNKDNAGVFTVFFAYLIARDFYYSLPLQFPKSINDHLWFLFQSHGEKEGAYRFMWALIVFFLFRHLIKSCLTQAFDLDPAARKPPSVDDDIPEFPKRTRR